MTNIGGVYFSNRSSFGLGTVDGGMVASLFGYVSWRGAAKIPLGVVL
jgi:hypothetical protein